MTAVARIVAEAPRSAPSARPRRPARVAAAPQPCDSSRSDALPMDLAAALAYSRYATAALAAHPGRARLARGRRRRAVRLGATRRALDAAGRAPATPRRSPRRCAALRRRRDAAHAGARPHRPRAAWPKSAPTMTRLAEVAVARGGRAASRGAGRRARRAARRATARAQRARSSSAWASSAAASSTSRRTSTWSSSTPRKARPTARARLSNREFFDRLGRRVIGALQRRHRRRLRLPRRHAAAALRRQRPADGAVLARSSST